MAAYRAAKLRLFAELLPPGAPAVANADMDADTLAALREIAARRGIWRCARSARPATAIRLLRADAAPDGQVLTVERRRARGTRSRCRCPAGSRRTTR